MYTVFAPKVLRPNTDYHISVSLYDFPAPIEVYASVVGPAHSVSTGAVTVGTAETKVLTLAIGNWPEGHYKVQVMGKGAQQPGDIRRNPWDRERPTVAITTDGFLNELPLNYVAKSVSVFIQTDKNTYKPGQKVQFRAVVVNPSLIPKDNIPIDIYIEDGNGKRVIEWTKLYATNGVIANELQLSAQPVLGHWTIGVTALRHNTTKKFTVADHMFPTTNVEIVLPTYVTVNQSQVVALVKAFDSNGKAVEGELSLFVRTIINAVPSKFFAKAKIYGSVTIPVDFKVHDHRYPDSKNRIEFTARVTETVTRKQFNGFNTVKVSETDVSIDMVKPSETCKPGLKNTVLLKVVTQDGKPVPDSGPQLKLKYGYSSDESEWRDSPLLLSPTNGFIKFDVIPPKDTFMMVVKPEYMGLTHDLKITIARTRCKHYMKVIRTDTTTITVGQDVKFMVTATEPIVRLVCEVWGKGDIVWAKSFDIQTNIHTGYEFSVATVNQMAPSARVLCHYVRPDDREVVADVLDFDVEPVFWIPISLKDVVNELKTYDTTARDRPFDFRSYWSATGDTFDDLGVGVMHNGFIDKAPEIVPY
ncbi:unnamed protein product [Medioppia subpectinata]|uniref:TEP1-F n=1 Tax=Medioppia subpectinata TaxID=1979941 RepID=A0A7R9KSW4_9ACAR|nr:unnamed protein product [Medioppia subpectinata]CAG2109258.1 unnamed protein product [Medioppia subpectinata]